MIERELRMESKYFLYREDMVTLISNWTLEVTEKCKAYTEENNTTKVPGAVIIQWAEKFIDDCLKKRVMVGDEVFDEIDELLKDKGTNIREVALKKSMNLN